MGDANLCPKCSAANPPDTRFCAKCGTPLVDPTGEQQTADPFLGKFVGERFLVKRRIGEGGMGVVYEAEQTAIDRKVALKVLHPHLADESLYARFRNEAAASSRLDHPNTITIYDFGRTDNDSLYIAMEFIEGHSLDDEIKSNGPLAWQRACRIGVQIAASLRNAHENGIIHRDMKPENIMLCRRGDDVDFVKVLDFGIAKIVEDDGTDQRKALTKTGMVFGTPQYMSPEQVRGEKIDHRADIYSVGIILYEMLTGRIPFSADTPMGLLTKHLLDEPPAFAQVGAGEIPAELEMLVMSALSKSADDRPQTMKDLGHALDGLLGVVHSGKTTVAAVSPGGGDNRISTDSATVAVSAMNGGGASGSQEPAVTDPDLVVPSAGSSKRGVLLVVLLLGLAALAAGGWWLFGGLRTPDAGRSVSVKSVKPDLPAGVNSADSGEVAGALDSGTTADNATDDDVRSGTDSAVASGDSDDRTPKSDIRSSTSVVSAGRDHQTAKGSGTSGDGNDNNAVNDEKSGSEKTDTAGGQVEGTAGGNRSDGGAMTGGSSQTGGGTIRDKLDARLSPGARDRCVISSTGGKTASLVARAIRQKESLLRGCIGEGTLSVKLRFFVEQNGTGLTGVNVLGGGATAVCMRKQVVKVRLARPAPQGGGGSITIRTTKKGGVMERCQGQVTF